MKPLFTISAWLIAISALAQLQVADLQPLEITGVRPQLSNDGSRVAYLAESSLNVMELSSGKVWHVVYDVELSDEVVFSPDGDMVAYSVQVYDNHLRYNELYATDLVSTKRYALDKPSRRRNAYRFAGGELRIGKVETVRRVSLRPDTKKAAHDYVLAIEEDDLVLYDGNRRRVLNPNGKNTYLWASLSPDEKKIVYMAVNDECHTFVYDLNTEVTDLGHYIAAPCWLDNQTIIGQQDEDDGHQMTASRLVAIRADGTGFQILPTQGYEHPINPTAAANTIVFENDGKLVKMTLRD